MITMFTIIAILFQIVVFAAVTITAINDTADSKAAVFCVWLLVAVPTIYVVWTVL